MSDLSIHLPSLPGYAKKSAPSSKRIRSFDFENGLRVDRVNDAERLIRDSLPHSLKQATNQLSTSPKSATARACVDMAAPPNFYGMPQQAKDRELYDNPNSGISKPLPFQNGIALKAPFLRTATVFRFMCYFTENVVESPSESFRVRLADIYFYLQDGTIHIEESKISNSGLSQGQYLRRSTILNPTHPGQAYTLKDLRVGSSVLAVGRDFHIVDCDGPSRRNLATLGFDSQPAALPCPKGQHDGLTELRGGDPTHNYGKQLTPMKYFMEAALGQVINTGGKSSGPTENTIIRFFLAWDDRASLYGTVSTFSMLYYCLDKTIEVVEDKKPNNGKDGLTLCLHGRKKMPKQHVGEIYNDAERGVEDPNPPGHYYEETDFQIGAVINVWGRPMRLIGCDSATQQYYMHKYSLPASDFTAIDVSDPPLPTYLRVPPTHRGIGSEEDSLASWLHLHPRKPKRDLKKLQEFDGKELNLLAIPQNGPSVKQGRTFSLKYYLMDDTIGVYGIPLKNSGVVPGVFLNRCKFKHPTEDRYYGPTDFFVDAEIILASNKFKLTYADAFTRDYIAGIPEPTSIQTAGQLTATMIAKLMAKKRSLGFLREAFRHVDEDSDSKITLQELKNYLQNSCCRGEKLDDMTAEEVFKIIDTDHDMVFDFNEFAAALEENAKLQYADLNISTSDPPVSVSSAAPSLRKIASAMMSDFKLFDKLVKRQVPGNSQEITVNVLRNSLLAISRHFKLKMAHPEIRTVLGYLFPTGDGSIETEALYTLLHKIDTSSS